MQNGIIDPKTKFADLTRLNAPMLLVLLTVLVLYVTMVYGPIAAFLGDPAGCPAGRATRGREGEREREQPGSADGDHDRGERVQRCSRRRCDQRHEDGREEQRACCGRRDGAPRG